MLQLLAIDGLPCPQGIGAQGILPKITGFVTQVGSLGALATEKAYLLGDINNMPSSFGKGAPAVLEKLQICEDVRPIDAENVAVKTKSSSSLLMLPRHRLPTLMDMLANGLNFNISRGNANRDNGAEAEKHGYEVVRNPVAKLRKMKCADLCAEGDVRRMNVITQPHRRSPRSSEAGSACATSPSSIGP
jgi:hypothetical protein